MVIGEQRMSSERFTAKATAEVVVGYSCSNNPDLCSSCRYTPFDWRDLMGVALALDVGKRLLLLYEANCLQAST